MALDSGLTGRREDGGRFWTLGWLGEDGGQFWTGWRDDGSGLWAGCTILDWLGRTTSCQRTAPTSHLSVSSLLHTSLHTKCRTASLYFYIHDLYINLLSPFISSSRYPMMASSSTLQSLWGVASLIQLGVILTLM